MRFVAARGAGFDVIFARNLRPLRDKALTEAGRDLMAFLLDLARQAGHVDPVPALRLLEQIIAIAHGYAVLDTDGFVTTARPSGDDIATRATNGAAALLRTGASPR